MGSFLASQRSALDDKSVNRDKAMALTLVETLLYHRIYIVFL
jgi:hypothetical protein